MAEAQKITAFSELTSTDIDDILAIVDDPAGGAATKKITVANLFGTSSPNDIRLGGATTASSDNTSQIQAAITEGVPVYIPDGTFTFASQLTNPDFVPITGPGELLFTGSGEHAIVFGQTSVAQAPINPNWWGVRLRRDTIVWEAGTDADFAGLQIINCTGLPIIVPVTGFDIGILLTAHDAGISHNRIIMLRAIDNRVDIKLHNTGTAGNPAVDTGFCNENRIWGPNSQVSSGRSSASNIHCIEYLKESTSVFNGNIFKDFSCEKTNTGAGFSSVIHGSGTADSSGNIAAQETYLFRFEGPDFILSGEGVTGNDIGMTSTTLSPNLDTDILNGTAVHDELLLALNRFHYPKERATVSATPVKIGSISRSNVCETDTTNIQAPARGAFWDASLNDFANLAAGTLQADFMNLTGADPVGILFDLRSVGSDYLQALEVKAVVEVTGGRICCVCWDSSFVKLTDASNNLGHCSLGTFSVPNGYWQTGTDITITNGRIRISFGNSVAYAFVGCAAGSAALQLRNIDYMRMNSADVMPRYDEDLMANLSNLTPVIPMSDEVLPTSFGTVPDVPAAGDNTPVFVRNTDLSELGSGVSTYLLIGWGWDGTAWHECHALNTDIPITAFAATVLDDATAAAARATLGTTVVSTTTALADITDAINTSADKIDGYEVFNTTTNIPVWANGSADGDVWTDATGATAHTPV